MKIFTQGLAAIVLMVAISVAWPTSTYAADKAENSRTMLRLSTKAADEKAKHDLLSVLQATGKFTQGNRIRVSGITMDTIPYGAGFKGLCRMDELFLVYGSPVKGRNSVEDRLQPVGVEAEPLFHVRKGPVASFEEPFARLAAWNDEDCRKLQSDESAQWFSAADARDAARGVNVVLAATAAIKSGLLKVPDCKIQLNGTTCEDFVLKRGQVDKISEVKKDCSAGPSEECYRIVFVDAIELTVVVSFGDDQAIAPSKVERLSAAEYVVVT